MSRVHSGSINSQGSVCASGSLNQVARCMFLKSRWNFQLRRICLNTANCSHLYSLLSFWSFNIIMCACLTIAHEWRRDNCGAGSYWCLPTRNRTDYQLIVLATCFRSLFVCHLKVFNNPEADENYISALIILNYIFILIWWPYNHTTRALYTSWVI